MKNGMRELRFQSGHNRVANEYYEMLYKQGILFSLKEVTWLSFKQDVMKGVFGILLTFCFCGVFAQNPFSDVPKNPLSPPPPTHLRDVFSTPIDPKPFKGIDGSPFLEDKWLLARIKAVGSAQTYDSIPIKLNIYSNTIYFVKDGEEMQMAMKVEAVKIIDSGSVWNNTVFLCNFDQEPGFYQVVEDGGKLKLLKKLWALIWESQPLNSEKLRRFEIQGDLFLSSGTKLYKSTKACSAIRDAFGQNDKLLDYISQNNLH